MMALQAVPGFPGNQTSLNPIGPGAAHIEHNFALIFLVTSIVYCLTMLVLVISVWRRRNTLNVNFYNCIPNRVRLLDSTRFKSPVKQFLTVNVFYNC